MTQNLKASKLSLAVNKAGTDGFEVDTSKDDELFSATDYSWNDLEELKNELGKGVLEFTAHVSSLVKNPEITNNLGADTTHFVKTITLFFDDINDFSERVRVLRVQHEGRSGPVKDMDEFSLYNRLAMNYHTLCGELGILVGPTVSELMLIVSKITHSAPSQETASPDVTAEVKPSE